MPSNALPPLFLSTTDNRGAPPVVIGYIGASITVLVTLIRVFLTIAKKQGLRIDDYLFLAGAILAVTTSITLERAVDHGLGRHAGQLTMQQLRLFVQFNYATALLGIFSQAAAKVSVAFLFERIAPRQDKRGITILLWVIGLWSVFAVFGTAFSCDGNISRNRSCGKGAYVLYPIAVSDMVTDGMLALWMVPRIWKLQTSVEHRVIPIMLMSSRLLVCFAQIGLIVVLAQSSISVLHGQDYSWVTAVPSTVYICVVHLSIITATIPRINSFVSDVQTKKAGLAFTQRDYELYQSSKSGSHNMSNIASRTRSPGAMQSRSHIQSAAEVLHGNHDFRPDRQIGRTNAFEAGHRRGSQADIEAIEMDLRDPETSSQSSLKNNAVYQKTEFHWTEEFTTVPSEDRLRR